MSSLDTLIENSQKKIEITKLLKLAHLHQFFNGE